MTPEPPCFSADKAHPSCSPLQRSMPASLAHAGVGGARSRAMSDRTIPEQPPRHRDLGQLERDVAAVADHLGADLDQLGPQRRQRLPRDLVGQRQGAQQVGQVVRERVQLQPHGVGGEAVTREPRPGDRVLAFLDLLLRRAALIIERHHRVGGARHIGDNAADPRIEFAGVPLHLHKYTIRLPANAVLQKSIAGGVVRITGWPGREVRVG